MLCVKDASGFLTNVDGYFGFDQYFLVTFFLVLHSWIWSLSEGSQLVISLEGRIQTR